MIGQRYWSVGITVEWDERGWFASLSFHDSGFTHPDSTTGKLYTTYPSHEDDEESLTRIIDLLKMDAERLGIEWRTPHLYVKGDGEDPKVPLPHDWVPLLRRQADRLGWNFYHHAEEMV